MTGTHLTPPRPPRPRHLPGSSLAANPRTWPFPSCPIDQPRHGPSSRASQWPSSTAASAWTWAEVEDEDEDEEAGESNAEFDEQIEILDDDGPAGLEILDEDQLTVPSPYSRESFAETSGSRVALPVVASRDWNEDRQPVEGGEEEGDFTLTRSGPMTVEELDLAPMVDVAFQLVLFFMVTATTVLFKTLEIPKPNSRPASGRRRPGDLARARRFQGCLRHCRNRRLRCDENRSGAGPGGIECAGRTAPDRPGEDEPKDDAALGRIRHPAPPCRAGL